ncbi:MAG: cytochrome c maturation protein CcmE domain-containing protein [Candidatus Cyclobacteriaceae bacterium M2_1C_046]
MKKIHIIGLAVIAIGVAIIVSTAGDASSYVNFTEAQLMATGGDDNKIHVVGELTKDLQGNVVGVMPSADKTSFYFTLIDENGFEQKVYHNAPEPQDFRRSEKVVIIGSYRNDMFVADKILLKCPSKYEENSVQAEM